MVAINDGAYEQLRQTLQKQHRRAYSLEEVKEIGDELLGFYMLLVDIKDRLERK